MTENVRKTHIAIVLDCSGSMDKIVEETVSGFNEQVQAVKTGSVEGQRDTSGQIVDVQTTLSLVTFSSNVDIPKFWCRAPEGVREMDTNEYKPNGATAMLDAVGYTLDRLQKRPDADDPDTSFLVIVISDGWENNSMKETYDTISRKIKACTDTGRWTFTYMGANQDLGEVAEKMAIPRGNTQSWVNDSAGTVYANSISNSAVSGFMEARVMTCMSATGSYYPGDSTSNITVEDLTLSVDGGLSWTPESTTPDK